MSFKEPFDWYAKEGYLTAKKLGGLTLYDYTQLTTYSGNWNYHTLTARGLILDESGKIIARPWPKFFTLGERPETALHALPDEIAELSTKYDGSQIIAFFNPEEGKWRGCTRGSWDNHQGIYATQWLQKHADKLDPAYTHIFELVAPWNQIVVFYPTEDMILTGLLHAEYGEDLSYARVREYGLARGLTSVEYKLGDPKAVNLEEKIINFEGYVARFSNGFRVKLKYGLYCLLHRIMTGYSAKGIWQSLQDGTQVDLNVMPPEFAEWFNKTKLGLSDDYKKIDKEVTEIFDKTPNFGSRREFFEYYRQFGPEKCAILLNMLDSKDYGEIIWDMIKPKGGKSFFQSTDGAE